MGSGQARAPAPWWLRVGARAQGQRGDPRARCWRLRRCAGAQTPPFLLEESWAGVLSWRWYRGLIASHCQTQTLLENGLRYEQPQNQLVLNSEANPFHKRPPQVKTGPSRLGRAPSPPQRAPFCLSSEVTSARGLPSRRRPRLPSPLTGGCHGHSVRRLEGLCPLPAGCKLLAGRLGPRVARK